MPTYVIRAFGGTLILGDGPTVALPTLLMAASFRDGTTHACYRDGREQALFRHGWSHGHYRDGVSDAMFDDGETRGESR